MAFRKQAATVELGQSINEYLVKLLAEVRRNPYEKFVLQQNYIQYRLIQIIYFRSGAKEREFEKNLDDSTLGTLINYFKVCVRYEKKEQGLLAKLKEYNKIRNHLTHKILSKKPSPYSDFEKSVIKANNVGLTVYQALDNIVEKQNKAIMIALRKISK